MRGINLGYIARIGEKLVTNQIVASENCWPYRLMMNIRTRDLSVSQRFVCIRSPLPPEAKQFLRPRVLGWLIAV